MDFEWAYFFRDEIEMGPGEKGFEKALEEALALSQSEKARARNLPGCVGGN